MKTDPHTLASAIRTNPLYDKWLERAGALLASGATAGTRYPEVWIRDLTTFIELALDYADPRDMRTALLTFFKFQGDDGGIIDGYTSKDASVDDYRFIRTPLCPDLNGHKNTVETDQESSLVQAVRIYVDKTGDQAFLETGVDGIAVIERMECALAFVRRERWTEKYGLVWNATTIDWGDVQPEHAWGVELDESSHPACCIYTNALYLSALRDAAELCRRTGRDGGRWRETADQLQRNIRAHLWDAGRGKFRPHLYLEKGSPFPEDFDEDTIYYHGGTACAILADLLSEEEIIDALGKMRANRDAAGVRTLGLTVWPVYRIDASPNPVFHTPFYYQNGGDWPWFGGRMVLALIQYGLIEEACEELQCILEMIDRVGDYYEWYAPDGAPNGAAEFRGAAGVVGLAIQKLRSRDFPNHENQ